jgi:hypothetical protein
MHKVDQSVDMDEVGLCGGLVLPPQLVPKSQSDQTRRKKAPTEAQEAMR